MLFELIDDMDTDIISALEQKCFDDDVNVKFSEDPRVIGAVQAIASKTYDLSDRKWNIDLLTFLDDYWVFSYLLKETGNVEAYRNLRDDFFVGFDPYASANPVTRIFAYCEDIEQSRSVDELDTLLDHMREDIGSSQSAICWRAYPILQKVAEHHRPYVEKVQDYERRVLKDIISLVRQGAAKVKEWEISEASALYSKARELAEYQLRDDEMADRISEHLKQETDRLVSSKDTGTESPDDVSDDFSDDDIYKKGGD